MKYNSAKKLVRLAALSLSFVVLGFGCKGLSVEQQSAVRPVTLKYWTVYNNVAELQKLTAEYKKIRPHVSVQIRQVRYSEFDRLFANSLADDVGPDVVSMSVRWLNKYKGRLSTMPASVQMSRLVQTGKVSKEIQVITENFGLPSLYDIRTGYVKAVGEDVIIDNQVYGLPLAMDTLAVYYNKELLDKAGIPEPPRSWNDFLEVVKKTTRFDRDGNIVQAGAALGTGSNIDNAFDIVSLLMAQSGVKMASGRAVTFASGVGRSNESHPAFRALDFYTDFARPTKESYTWNEKMGSSLDEFVRGRVVFYVGFAFDYDRIRAQAPGMAVEVIAVPQLNPASPSSVASYWVESVVKKSRHQNEAWDFVRFLSLPDNVKTYTEATFRPSPFRAHIAEQQKNPRLEPFASQVLFAENWYKGSDVDSAMDAFVRMVDAYREPAPTDEARLKRDKQLVDTTAQIVQQTM